MCGCPAGEKPNLVIIFADDLGYGDLGCYGSKTIKTPRLDRMAPKACGFPTSTPSPSAALARRADDRLLSGAGCDAQNRVAIMPRLHLNEITIARCSRRGLRHDGGGKWHLAGQSQTGYEVDLLPTIRFRRLFGTSDSNDAVVT